MISIGKLTPIMPHDKDHDEFHQVAAVVDPYNVNFSKRILEFKL